MKKQILNLGKVLNKAEQKTINGGDVHPGCIAVCEHPELFAPKWINFCNNLTSNCEILIDF